MTAKEYLKNIAALDLEIKSLLDRVKQLRQDAEGLQSMRISEMPRGGCPRTVEDIISDILDLQRKYADRLDDINEKKRQAEHIIEQIHRPEYRTVLRLRYISGKRWRDIADLMEYSLSNVYSLHGRALVEFEKYYQQKGITSHAE